MKLSSYNVTNGVVTAKVPDWDATEQDSSPSRYQVTNGVLTFKVVDAPEDLRL